MQAATQGLAAAASSMWAAHAAFASVDTPAAQTMVSFFPTMAVSELSPQLLVGTLALLARGGFGDDAAIEEAVENLSRLNLRGLTWAQVCALVTRVAGLASLLPLLSMAQDVASARDVCVAALRSAGVPPRLSDTPPTILRALVAALPVHVWLRFGIESQQSITYGRVPAREGPSRRSGAQATSDRGLKHLKLDLLWHRENLRRGPRGAPVLMYCHGGGWVIGSRKYHSVALMLAAARAGWLVATVDYRLAPGVAFPHMLLDCKAALAWLRRHVGAYGGDSRFIAVAGESAGGHLALLLGLTPNVPAYQPSARGDGSSDRGSGCDTSVDAVVDLYGVADWTDSRGAYARRWHGTGSDAFRPFLEQLVLQRSFDDHTHEFVRASPLWWVQGAAVGHALRAAGVDVRASAALPSDSAAGPGGSKDAATEEVAVETPEAAAVFVHRSSAGAPGLPEGTPVSPLLADMAVDRRVPPVMIVHGSADTLVPLADSEAFWEALTQRRARDTAAEERQGTARVDAGPTPAPDLFVRLPHAHHAFNFVTSARALAMGDAVLDWLECVYEAATSSPAAAAADQQAGAPTTAVTPRL